MCGIIGICSDYIDKQLLKKSTNMMIHRGPDDYGYYTDKNIGLGSRRLSIIDLSKKDIIEGFKISRAALFKYWKQLEEQEIVLVARQFGKTKLYTLNSANPIIKKLLELESMLIGKALDKQKLIEVPIKITN